MWSTRPNDLSDRKMDLCHMRVNVLPTTGAGAQTRVLGSVPVRMSGMSAISEVAFKHRQMPHDGPGRRIRGPARSNVEGGDGSPEEPELHTYRKMHAWDRDLAFVWGSAWL